MLLGVGVMAIDWTSGVHVVCLLRICRQVVMSVVSVICKCCFVVMTCADGSVLSTASHEQMGQLRRGGSKWVTLGVTVFCKGWVHIQPSFAKVKVMQARTVASP